MDSCMRAYSTVQQLLCHGGYCELILSLARTSCRLLFNARPTARPLAGNPLHDVVRSRNPSKSTLAHDAVATAVLHKHHPIIRVGAGLIQFVFSSHLRLVTEATRNRNAFSPFFPRVSKEFLDSYSLHRYEFCKITKTIQKVKFLCSSRVLSCLQRFSFDSVKRHYILKWLLVFFGKQFLFWCEYRCIGRGTQKGQSFCPKKESNNKTRKHRKTDQLHY